MRKKQRNEAYDVVVVGGGMAGCGAALAAARHGAKVCLVHNRPMPGGNAGSESRLHALGADCHVKKPDCRESGIIEEILLENKRRNPEHSFAVFDLLLWEKLRYQESLTLRLNTHMTDARAEGGAVTCIIAEDMLTEERLVLEGKVFIDCTGDGVLAHYAGAEWMHGRESADAYQELDAPAQANHHTMGNTLQFVATDRGHDVPFETPPWIHHFAEDELAKRGHNVRAGDPYIHGYWWNELGGGAYDTIDGANEIRDDLLRALIGVWDHLKNGGHHPQAAPYELEWLQTWPSKRESRRIKGPYVLTETDVLAGRVFDDAVAYGGWRIDMHAPDSVFDTRSHLSVDRHFDGVYTIPYRCLVAEGMDNLLMAGRPISATSLAHSSARVISTACITGQAAGTAAAIAVKENTTAAGVGAHMDALQQQLLRDGCFIPSVVNTDAADVARDACATASSAQAGHGAGLVTDGVARNWLGSHGWVSEAGDAAPWLALSFGGEKALRQVQVTFDSDYNREICTTLSLHMRALQYQGPPDTLARDFEVAFYLGDACVLKKAFRDHYQAVCRITLAEPVRCDRIKLTVQATHGDPCARVFEVRAYESMPL